MIIIILLLRSEKKKERKYFVWDFVGFFQSTSFSSQK
jgi:hypothetical protein